MLVITPGADRAPGHCSASGTTVGPFIQTGRRSEAGAVQVSVAWIKSIAEEIGLVDADILEKSLTERDELMAAVEQMAARIERFDEDVQNVADAMVSWLGLVKAHTDAATEIAETRDAVGVLTALVEKLEGGSAAQETA